MGDHVEVGVELDASGFDGAEGFDEEEEVVSDSDSVA